LPIGGEIKLGGFKGGIFRKIAFFLRPALDDLLRLRDTLTDADEAFVNDGQALADDSQRKVLPKNDSRCCCSSLIQ
jgi:hypothetical protein